MRKSTKINRTADQIAAGTTRGEDISSYFTNQFTVVRPVRRVNIRFTDEMLRKLDAKSEVVPSKGKE